MNMRGCSSFPSFLRAVPLLSTFVLALPVAAQGRSEPVPLRFGVGYVANAPEMMAGGAGYVILPVLGGVGLYVDAKFDLSSPEDEDNFDPGLTAQDVDDELGDEFIDNASSWRSFNAAVVRPLTPSLMMYAGAGYVQETAYREYHDDTGTRGLAGYYWVESPDEDATRVNVLIGMFLRLTPWVNAQFGVESAPRGATVGASITLPPGG